MKEAKCFHGFFYARQEKNSYLFKDHFYNISDECMKNRDFSIRNLPDFWQKSFFNQTGIDLLTTNLDIQVSSQVIGNVNNSIEISLFVPLSGEQGKWIWLRAEDSEKHPLAQYSLEFIPTPEQLKKIEKNIFCIDDIPFEARLALANEREMAVEEFKLWAQDMKYVLLEEKCKITLGCPNVWIEGNLLQGGSLFHEIFFVPCGELGAYVPILAPKGLHEIKVKEFKNVLETIKTHSTAIWGLRIYAHGNVSGFIAANQNDYFTGNQKDLINQLKKYTPFKIARANLMQCYSGAQMILDEPFEDIARDLFYEDQEFYSVCDQFVDYVQEKKCSERLTEGDLDIFRHFSRFSIIENKLPFSIPERLVNILCNDYLALKRFRESLKRHYDRGDAYRVTDIKLEILRNRIVVKLIIDINWDRVWYERAVNVYAYKGMNFLLVDMWVAELCLQHLKKACVSVIGNMTDYFKETYDYSKDRSTVLAKWLSGLWSRSSLSKE